MAHTRAHVHSRTRPYTAIHGAHQCMHGHTPPYTAHTRPYTRAHRHTRSYAAMHAIHRYRSHAGSPPHGRSFSGAPLSRRVQQWMEAGSLSAPLSEGATMDGSASSLTSCRSLLGPAFPHIIRVLTPPLLGVSIRPALLARPPTARHRLCTTHERLAGTSAACLS